MSNSISFHFPFNRSRRSTQTFGGIIAAMDTRKDSKLRSQFPHDLAALLGIYWIILPVAILNSAIFPWILRAKNESDTTLFWVAIVLGCIGSLLLFIARLPLYRQGRFSQFGPRGLDAAHRRLYHWSWLFIFPSILLLCILLLILR